MDVCLFFLNKFIFSMLHYN